MLIAVATRPVIEGIPVNTWAMQKDGRFLYDVHKDEIGRDLFTDPLFKPDEQLLGLRKGLPMSRRVLASMSI